ncbi:hypothetical protein KAR91_52560 [Candidatus Pacearchaeota archaeon]|nr:hypothetical protein [Candidatus Pacearchaeota archaeon]
MSSEEIIIDGIKYDCVKDSINKFILILSVSEAEPIFEIFKNRREVPMYFRGANKSAFIDKITQQTMIDKKRTLLIEIV